MFDNLTERLSNSFKAIQGKNKLSDENIKEAIREVRRSLLEADVALDVIKFFIERVQEKAIGLKVGEGLSPSQAFIKLVEAELTEVIGGQNESLNLATQPPAVIMVAGLEVGPNSFHVAIGIHLTICCLGSVAPVAGGLGECLSHSQLPFCGENSGYKIFPAPVRAK